MAPSTLPLTCRPSPLVPLLTTPLHPTQPDPSSPPSSPAGQVGSLREYMGGVERLNAQLAERLRAVEAALQAEAERGRSVGAAARQLQGQMDELLSIGHVGAVRSSGQGRG